MDFDAPVSSELSVDVTPRNRANLRRLKTNSLQSFQRWEKENELLYAMIEDESAWLSKLFPEVIITPEFFFFALEDGTLLCKLANYIQEMADAYGQRRNVKIPGRKLKFKESKRGHRESKLFHSRENVQKFLTWCRWHDIPEAILFESNDVVLVDECRTGGREIVICLMEIARRVLKYEIKELPKLIQLEQEIDEEVENESDVSIEDEQGQALETASVNIDSQGAGDRSPIDSDSGVDSVFDEGDHPTSPRLAQINADSENELRKDPEPPKTPENPQKFGKGQKRALPSLLDSAQPKTELDKKVCKIAENYNIKLVHRLKEGKYIILGKIMFVRMLNDHLLVRIGGGWDTLEHYIMTHAPKPATTECSPSEGTQTPSALRTSSLFGKLVDKVKRRESQPNLTVKDSPVVISKSHRPDSSPGSYKLRDRVRKKISTTEKDEKDISEAIRKIESNLSSRSSPSFTSKTFFQLKNKFAKRSSCDSLLDSKKKMADLTDQEVNGVLDHTPPESMNGSHESSDVVTTSDVVAHSKVTTVTETQFISDDGVVKETTSVTTETSNIESDLQQALFKDHRFSENPEALLDFSGETKTTDHSAEDIFKDQLHEDNSNPEGECTEHVQDVQFHSANPDPSQYDPKELFKDHQFAENPDASISEYLQPASTGSNEAVADLLPTGDEGAKTPADLEQAQPTEDSSLLLEPGIMSPSPTEQQPASEVQQPPAQEEAAPTEPAEVLQDLPPGVVSPPEEEQQPSEQQPLAPAEPAEAPQDLLQAEVMTPPAEEQPDSEEQQPPALEEVVPAEPSEAPQEYVVPDQGIDSGAHGEEKEDQEVESFVMVEASSAIMAEAFSSESFGQEETPAEPPAAVIEAAEIAQTDTLESSPEGLLLELDQQQPAPDAEPQPEAQQQQVQQPEVPVQQVEVPQAETMPESVEPQQEITPEDRTTESEILSPERTMSPTEPKSPESGEAEPVTETSIVTHTKTTVVETTSSAESAERPTSLFPAEEESGSPERTSPDDKSPPSEEAHTLSPSSVEEPSSEETPEKSPEAQSPLEPEAKTQETVVKVESKNPEEKKEKAAAHAKEKPKSAVAAKTKPSAKTGPSRVPSAKAGAASRTTATTTKTTAKTTVKKTEDKKTETPKSAATKPTTRAAPSTTKAAPGKTGVPAAGRTTTTAKTTVASTRRPDSAAKKASPTGVKSPPTSAARTTSRPTAAATSTTKKPPTSTATAAKTAAAERKPATKPASAMTSRTKPAPSAARPKPASAAPKMGTAKSPDQADGKAPPTRTAGMKPRTATTTKTTVTKTSATSKTANRQPLTQSKVTKTTTEVSKGGATATTTTTVKKTTDAAGKTKTVRETKTTGPPGRGVTTTKKTPESKPGAKTTGAGARPKPGAARPKSPPKSASHGKAPGKKPAGEEKKPTEKKAEEVKTETVETQPTEETPSSQIAEVKPDTTETVVTKEVVETTRTEVGEDGVTKTIVTQEVTQTATQDGEQQTTTTTETTVVQDGEVEES